jgi:hypothetical protein
MGLDLLQHLLRSLAAILSEKRRLENKPSTAAFWRAGKMQASLFD